MSVHVVSSLSPIPSVALPASFRAQLWILRQNSARENRHGLRDEQENIEIMGQGQVLSNRQEERGDGNAGCFLHELR